MNRKKRKTRKKYHYPSPISVRFSDEERALLEDAAGDLTLSTYIKYRLFGDMVKIRTRSKKPVKDQAQLAQLLAWFGQSRMKNNATQIADYLNSMAHAANSGSLPLTREIQHGVAEIGEILNWVKDTLIAALHECRDRHRENHAD